MKKYNSKTTQSSVRKTKTLFTIFSILMFALLFQSCSGELVLVEDCIQRSLDEGMTPIEVYNNCDLEYESMVGYHYGGGIIIQFDGGTGTGLIASLNDLEDSPFGCHKKYISSFNEDIYEFYDSGDGLKNTMEILDSNCGEISAAKICSEYSIDGYDDWFLPSIGTLYELNLTNAIGEYWSSNLFLNDSTSARTLIINQKSKCKVSSSWFGPITICTFVRNRDSYKKVRAVRRF